MTSSGEFTVAETIRILLVEDDPNHVELIRRVLAAGSPRFALEEATTIGEARDALRRSPPDLVLTDWKLPDGQGIELLRDTARAGLPLVVMTSHGSERVAVQALQAGALDYVVKSPESFAELPRTLERALREWRGRDERQRIQAALEHSEERLRLIAENVSDVIWTSDLGLRISYVTPSVERLHGWTVPEWTGLRPEDYIAPGSLGFVRQALEDEFARHRPGQPQHQVTLEVEQLRRDGSPFWTEVTARFLLDASGAPVGIVGVTRDATERKRAERELLESRERYRDLIEGANSVILRWDTEGRIMFINPFGLQLFGYTEEELVGRSVMGTIVADVGLDGRDLQEMIRAIETDPARFQRNENENLCKDGQRVWVDWTNRPIHDPDGRLTEILSVGNDVTARNRAEAERRLLEEQLVQSQKIESVGTLAGGVAHDFNNMLSPIIGYAEMLRDELPAGDKRRTRAEAIISAGERCRDLVHQLLAFARKQTLEMRRLDLNTVVSGFETILRRTLRENIAIELRLAPAIGMLLGDSRQIEQVLLNLAVNARDAMPEGGRLLIETADVTLDQEYARAHEWVVPGPYVRLAVGDTGVGMDRETLAKVFDPFFTTKDVGKGTGLGLAMVYGIVKQHGGSVEAESEPGRGTTFRVHFPRVAGVESAVTTEGEAPRTRGGETVLIVEDEDQVLTLAAEILRIHGYKVLEAGNAAQALAALAAHPAGIDLLLTDVILTDANGRTLHERIAAGGSRHAVLYMSGYTADVIGRHGVLDEGVALISKPFSVSKLAAKVREVLDRQA